MISRNENQLLLYVTLLNNIFQQFVRLTFLFQIENPEFPIPTKDIIESINLSTEKENRKLTQSINLPCSNLHFGNQRFGAPQSSRSQGAPTWI